MSISPLNHAPERASSAEQLRDLLGVACSKKEFDDAIRKLDAGGSDSAAAWLWFQTLMANLPGEQRSADGRFAPVRGESGERLNFVRPDVATRRA